MSTPSSTPSRRSRPSSALAAAAALAALAAAACSDPQPAAAQQVVFDPKNHVENALQAARQLESLANEARMLANQARQLAASPYSHLGETSRTLRDIGELARTVKGVASDVRDLERQFADLYPTAVEGLDPRKALQQHRARTEAARDTAQDLARTAAELERLAATRERRISGALSASQSASGQTAAIQSSNQLLTVLAEDLGSLRTILLAQSRLMAEDTARRAAERAAAAEARRRFWGRDASTPANPEFDPYSPVAR
ncbi:P-type conjugative transfer protein TrbJ [Phenylobacterium terrae]|uniref:P-type conjugative transfer protein TrbJ n=1 Tax=Phenylobacterium terrae TaxID=2665495 RepID=A0ABW4N6A6_9CAUL